jgi:hypothetical protein
LLWLSVTHDAVFASSWLVDSPEMASMTLSEQPPEAAIVVGTCAFVVVVCWPFGTDVPVLVVVEGATVDVGSVAVEPPQAATVTATASTVRATVVAVPGRLRGRARFVQGCSPSGTGGNCTARSSEVRGTS